MNDQEESSQKGGNMDFVHPVEEEFAKILDYYGVKWQYEPKTFALAWDGSGSFIQRST